MDQDNSLLWSSLGFVFGGLLLVFVASLRSSLEYKSTFQDSAHMHLALSLLLIFGMLITILSLMGMILALLRH